MLAEVITQLFLHKFNEIKAKCLMLMVSHLALILFKHKYASIKVCYKQTDFHKNPLLFRI